MKKIGLHPLTIILGLVLFLTGHLFIFINFFIVVVLHELAHAFIAKKLGYKLGKIFLLPFGAGLTFKQNFASEKDEIYIALAGPVFNFCLGLFFIALWWIEPVLFNYTKDFVFANIAHATINLLPCYPLDGGRIFVGILNSKLKRKTSLKICFIFNYVISFIFVIFFFLSFPSGANITFALMAIFIFFGTIEDKLSGNYNFLNFPFNSKRHISKDTFPVKTISVKSQIPLYKLAKNLDKNKYNLIYVLFENQKIKVLTEQTLENLILTYPPTIPLKNILKP